MTFATLVRLLPSRAPRIVCKFKIVATHNNLNICHHSTETDCWLPSVSPIPDHVTMQ